MHNYNIIFPLKKFSYNSPKRCGLLSMETKLKCDLESVKLISNAIEKNPEGRLILASENQKLSLSEGGGRVYYLISGEVEVRRKSDDIIVINIESPAIIGLTSLYEESSYHYLKTIMPSNLISISKSDAVNIIDSENLWKSAFKIVSMAAFSYYKRDELIISTNVYSIIRRYLLILENLPEDEKNDISLFDYILKRTTISRSSLNKILRDLVEGGYISINRGRLVKILKTLPLNY